MNRSLMGRQMFAKGGAAFPDYSGDGEITQKDILMGRGVIPRTMQEGGMVDPMMMQAPDPMMMQEPAPQGGEVDPDVLAGMFGEIEGQIQGLDQAEDIEGMMNAVRGDQQPVEARRAELAELVGPEDAQDTPDSVLALVQPIMQLAAVDQGIGGLAADSMGDVAMEGPMAEGIMSTVNTAPPTDQAMMAPPMDPAMMGVGNQPPVNFRYGGAVQYMQAGGPPGADPVSPIQTAFDQRRDLYRSIIGDDTAQDQAMLDERRDLTKSQMLFDIANTALAFSTPGSRQMSPAQRLAEAARETQLLDKFGARTGAIQDLKDKQALDARSANRSLDMAALSSAEKDVEGQQAITAALTKARLGRAPKFMRVVGGGTSTIVDVNQFGQAQLDGINEQGYTLENIVDPEKGFTNMYNPKSGAEEVVKTSEIEAFLAKPDNAGFLQMSNLTRPKTDTSFSASEATALVTDQKILDGFADGTLTGTDFNRFENTLIGQIRAKTITTATGEVITTPGQSLTGAQRKAIEARLEINPDSVSLQLKEYVRPSLNDVLPYSAADLDALIAEQNKIDPNVPSTIAKPRTTTLDRDVLQSPEFFQSLLNNSGTIDVNAKGFTLMPTQTVQDVLAEGIDVSVAQGLSRIVPAAKLFFTEPLSDSFGVNVPEGARDLVKADVALKNIAQRIERVLIANRQGSRMLSTEYEKLSENIDNIRPGTFTFDATGLGVLNGAIGLVAAAMDTDLEAVPEWGGSTTDANATRLAKRRERLRTSTALMAEMVQLRNSLETSLGKNQDVVGNPMKDALKGLSSRQKTGS